MKSPDIDHPFPVTYTLDQALRNMNDPVPPPPEGKVMQ